MEYVIGLDLGTSGLKALVVNKAGNVVDHATATYPLSAPYSGFSEQNPTDWLKAAKKVIGELAVRNQAMRKNVVGISISGQMHSLVLLDEKKQPLRPAILWNDVRTTAQCQKISQLAGKQVLATTKNRALEGFTLPKLLWVKENEPEVWRQAATFLLPKDYLGYWFTGSIQTDYSDAAGTLLLDVRKQAWDWQLAELFEIPRKIFPKLVQSMSCIGTIRAELAEELGLSPKVKVFAGGADNACAALGAGIITTEIGLVSIGTSGVFLAFEGKEQQNYQGKLHYFNHVVPDCYYSMGVTLAAGQSLSWFKNAIAPAESFVEFLQGIAEIPAGSEGLLFSPYIMGERTPYFDSQIRGSFIGMDVRHTKAHFIRAVLEGITFSLKDSQMIMADSAHKKLRKIVSVGGGAKNQEWLQIQADILNREIVTLETEQGPGLGAAMLAAVGSNWFDTLQECVTHFVRYDHSYLPNSQNTEKYQLYYALYKDLYMQTSSLSHRLQKLVK